MGRSKQLKIPNSNLQISARTVSSKLYNYFGCYLTYNWSKLLLCVFSRSISLYTPRTSCPAERNSGENNSVYSQNSQKQVYFNLVQHFASKTMSIAISRGILLGCSNSVTVLATVCRSSTCIQSLGLSVSLSQDRFRVIVYWIVLSSRRVSYIRINTSVTLAAKASSKFWV